MAAPTDAPVPTPPTPVAEDHSRMVAFLGNWQTCPTSSQLASYTHIMISFAVSYIWTQSGNICSPTCEIYDPPVCENIPQPTLVQQWRSQGKKVLLSFGGASMGGSWAGNTNFCWDACFGQETYVINRLIQLVNTMGLDGIDIDYEYHVTPQAVNFLNTVTAGLKTGLPAGSEITHAPMDSDIRPGYPYYDNVLTVIGDDLDFLMPQYYNGVTRPALDGIGSSGAGQVSALSHYTTLVNNIFAGDQSRMVFGFCISDCGSTSSNVNSAQASTVMSDLAQSFPCHGGAFFWVVEHDINGAWSSAVSSTINSQTCAAPTAAPQSGANSDPIILGLQNQVFKFYGRDGAWYSNVSTKNMQWNMQFKEFKSCPVDENMFISGMMISTSDSNESWLNSNILIVTTPEPTSECREDPNTVCLGEGTLHLSFDEGKTFISKPGDYHFASGSRVVAHNTYAACSRKWYDYDVIRDKQNSRLREGSRRASSTIGEKKPLALLSHAKHAMIDPSGCSSWFDERLENDDLFEQRGHWSTLYVETPLVSFHVEYRRSDWFHRKCDFQSLDAWMTTVSERVEKSKWNGILGETKHKIFDESSGEQILSDRSKLLRGQDDSDYEVDGPFGTDFAAKKNQHGVRFDSIINTIMQQF